MRIIRWTLLILYLGLVLGLFVLGLSGSQDDDGLWIVLAVTIAADALFILGAGSKDLFRPIRRPRLLLPVVAASFMLAVLVVGLTCALVELFLIRPGDFQWLLLFVGVWIFWAFLLYVYTRPVHRYQVIYRLARLVFAGSLAELLAAAPAHILVSRRGGCFVGLNTFLAILAGLYVLIWSFGPAIFLLFLQEARRRESRHTPTAAQKEPPRHSPWQFQLRTLLLVMLATSIASAMLKTFWLQWPAAAIAALVSLALMMTLLAACRWLLVPVSLGVLVGIAWVFWGQWTTLAVLALPTAILAVLLLKLFLRRPPIDPPGV